MINRNLKDNIIKEVTDGRKAVILLGARQVGKTTLIKALLDREDVMWLNGDAMNDRMLLSDESIEQLKVFIGNNKVLVIDEAQRIDNIGLILKLIIDNIPELKVVVTGSSSLELADKTAEPLTGRKRQFTLYPLSYNEMSEHHGIHSEYNLIEHRLIFGYYPDVANNPGEERLLLQELADSYLYKDILTLDKIKKADYLTRLLRALAYQIGSQVSYTELGQLCGLDYKTIERYIDILEQVFIIYRLTSYSRNLRNELKKSRKIYFVDNGIRNAVINDYRPIQLREDVGQLWENFLVSERIKQNEYSGSLVKTWFWRTQTGQEIDYLEEKDGHIAAYEFKWNERAKTKQPRAFLEAYPGSSFEVVHKKNINQFLLYIV